MIDQDDLDYLEQKIDRKLANVDLNPWFTINPEPAKDLIRLARLGFWAQTFGIPFVENCGAWDVSQMGRRRNSALAALPTVKGST